MNDLLLAVFAVWGFLMLAVCVIGMTAVSAYVIWDIVREWWESL